MSDRLSPMLSLLPSLPPEMLEAMQRRLQAVRSTDRLAEYRPYEKQRAFHAIGLTHRERLFMAGNQLGKTIAGGSEYAFHLTGEYPGWWAGRRFGHPVAGWAAGITGLSTRDTVQRIMLGRPGEWGTGAIPKRAIIDIRRAQGLPDQVDAVLVRHKGGAQSSVNFKSYEQGREKWQGETLDLVWFDEEPPLEIYSEGLTRTNAGDEGRGGMVFTTFTPLLGMSEVVKLFWPVPDTAARHVTSMTIDDAEHYSPERRAEIIAGYPAHEREARARGIPMLGSGRVFPVPESAITCEAFAIPAHWPLLGALDFGWDHPTAAVRVAWDRDTDTLYVVAAYRRRQASVIEHVSALRPWGDQLPWAWPHDGLQHDKGSGEQLAAQYRAAGLNMLPERATFPDGTNGVEAGIQDLLTRMETGRFKVFAHLADWLDEFRGYHRKDGKIVKLADDVMSATRYAAMTLRHAQVSARAKSPNLKLKIGGLA